MRTKNFTRFLPLLLLMLFSIMGGKAMAQSFYESFDNTKGSGGNAGGWSGNIASSQITTDNDGWYFKSGKGASQCVKLGASNALGSATTPAINLSGDLVLTFKAGAWKGDKKNIILSIEGTGTLSQTSVEMKNEEWKDYTVNISGAVEGFKIKFEASETVAEGNKNRFFLDEVSINKSGAPVLQNPGLAYAETSKTVDVSDAAFTNALTNPNSVSVTYSSSNVAVATVDANSGLVTPVATGNTTISAVFAGNDTYKAQTVSYELTVNDKSAPVYNIYSQLLLKVI